MSIRILLVDDHQSVRDGLGFVIRTQADMEVVGEAANGEAARAKVAEVEPDLIMMDVHLPDTTGIEVTRQVLERFAKVRIIILSADPDEELVNQALRAGASGYLLKTNPTAEVLQAIRFVMAGKTFLSPEVASTVAASYRQLLNGKAGPKKPELSGREREVLKLIAEGLRTKDIAVRLNLGVKTVETHRANLMAKLKCTSTVELARYALREGIASL
jgi:DNA-binding NarL/FixJ family response regulator